MLFENSIHHWSFHTFSVPTRYNIFHILTYCFHRNTVGITTLLIEEKTCMLYVFLLFVDYFENWTFHYWKNVFHGLRWNFVSLKGFQGRISARCVKLLPGVFARPKLAEYETLPGTTLHWEESMYFTTYQMDRSHFGAEFYTGIETTNLF